MTIPELRAVIQQQEEHIARHNAGYYVGPPIPQLNQYKERLDVLETQQQEEQNRLEHHRRVEVLVRRQEAEHIAAVQAKRQEVAKRAEREHKEELDRQAAMTETPAEQIAQQPQDAAPPIIGEGQAVQVITSSTVSSA
eukprot:5751070-Amphidinium_carterae.1